MLVQGQPGLHTLRVPDQLGLHVETLAQKKVHTLLNLDFAENGKELLEKEQELSLRDTDLSDLSLSSHEHIASVCWTCV